LFFYGIAFVARWFDASDVLASDRDDFGAGFRDNHPESNDRNGSARRRRCGQPLTPASCIQNAAAHVRERTGSRRHDRVGFASFSKQIRIRVREAIAFFLFHF
jgi:hypothetical protein